MFLLLMKECNIQSLEWQWLALFYFGVFSHTFMLCPLAYKRHLTLWTTKTFQNLKLHLIHEFDHYCSPFSFQPNFMESWASFGSDTDF